MSSNNDRTRTKTTDSRRTNRRPWSLALRLTIWYTCSAFALVLIATGILYWALVVNLDRQDDQFLIDEVHILRDLLAERPEYADAIRQEVEWESAARRYARVFVRLLDRDGSIVAETPGMSDVLVPNRFPPAVAATDVTLGVDTMTSDGTPYRLLAARTNTATTDGPTTIQIAVDRIQHRALLAQSRKTLFAVLLLVLAISSLAAHVIARRGIQPIVEVTATARRIRSTTLHERIEEAHFPAELAELAETFNEMLDRLQESFDRLSRFSADIAHELRTPVNNLRGEAEVTLGNPRSEDEYRESLTSCLEESVRLSRIIDGLLLMARAETPSAEVQRETVDLRAEFYTLREFYEAAGDEAGIRLTFASETGLRILANRSLLQRAIGNLVENALAHTPTGGDVRVSATDDNGEIRIIVSDTGCGIPAEDVPHVFDRFYRVERDRSSSTGGSGLGLAIVRSIVELHGGEVSLQCGEDGGMQFVMSFPAALSNLHHDK